MHLRGDEVRAIRTGRTGWSAGGGRETRLPFRGPLRGVLGRRALLLAALASLGARAGPATAAERGAPADDGRAALASAHPEPGAPAAVRADEGADEGAAAASADSADAPRGARVRLGWLPLEGLVVEDPERPDAPLVHLGGIFALDYRHYDRRNARDRALRLDRALVVLDGEPLEGLTFRAVADLRGTDTQQALDELWVGYSPAPWLRVRAGLMKIALGVESSFAEQDLPFVDYAFPFFVDARTDWALRVDGEVAEGLLSYDVAFAVGSGFDAFGQRHGDPQLSIRVVSYPLRAVDLAIGPEGYRIPLLSGFHVGVAWAYGFGYEADLDVATSLRNKLFLTPRIEARAYAVRHFGYGFDLGPFRFFHEFSFGSFRDIEAPNGEDLDLKDEIHSWAMGFSWMVTGEPYDSRPFRQVQPGLARAGRERGAFPRRPLWGAARDEEAGFGALELAVRYSNGDIARELVDAGFTTLDVSSQEFRTFDAAVNWYPSAGVRLGVQVTRVIADQFPAVFDSHGRDTSVAVRLQIAF